MAQLEITVVEARNLLKKDTLSENDPFVRLYLDNKDLSQKTKTKNNCKNPQWNQTFVFNHLTGQDVLHVDVFDRDSVRNEKIGSTTIDLRPLYQSGYIDQWFNLPGKLNLRSHGEIHLILRYERLKI